MWRHNFLTCWRNLKRNKLFTFLNIFGLTIGMVGALLIALLIRNTVTFDRFHKEEDRLFLMHNLDRYDGEVRAWPSTPKMLGPYMKTELPEVEGMTRLDRAENLVFNYNEKKIRGRGSVVDPDFFTMFNFPFIKGEMDSRWAAGQGVIITRDFAKAIFGNDQAVGKSLKVDSTTYLTVSGVLESFPTNTFFSAPFFVSWEYARNAGELDSSWGNNSVRTYVKLAPGVQEGAFNQKVYNFTREHDGDLTTHNFLQPLSEVNLYNQQENGKYTTGRIRMVRTLLIIGILLMVIACINFMNLSTARSGKRAREVGVKKIIGASRRNLAFQFLMESMMIAFISFLFALLIANLLLPFFDRLIEQPLKFQFSWQWWVFTVFFVLLTGVLAGAYPALQLSAFKPIIALKGSFRQISRRFNLRAILVVTQFSIAIILILTTIMITRDLRFVQERDKGYSGNGLAYTFLEGNLESRYESLRNDLLASGAVTSVSKNMSPVTQQFSNGWGFSWPGSTKEDDMTTFVRYSTDADMVKTMGMQLVEGRDIDIYKYRADSTAAILNESAVAAMRLKSPIGTVIKDNNLELHVVGVIKDFIIDLPSSQVVPMVVGGPSRWFEVIHYRLNPNRSAEKNLAVIQSLFDKYNPDYPFAYFFADEDYAAKFKETKQYGQLSMLFAGLTIFISCLGLFGLISSMAESKTKEIGIRKVLGASITGIIGLLSKGFLKLALIAYLIAVPVSIIIMHKWMARSVYHTSIQAIWFVIAALLTLIIVFATIGFQAFKAARANPVNSLKSE